MLGLFLPWSAWAALGWEALLFPLLVSLLRRIPGWLLLWRVLPSLRSRKDAAFCGWLGPIGIAALCYTTLATGDTGLTVVWTLASLAITASILLHGITSTPATQSFSGRRVSGSERSHEHQPLGEGGGERAPEDGRKDK